MWEAKLMRKPYLRALAILVILGGCTGPRVKVAPGVRHIEHALDVTPFMTRGCN